LIAEDEEKADEAVLRLARVGLETVAGYLAGGMNTWHGASNETATIEQISVEELHRRLDKEPELQVLDVRRAAEYESDHVPGARLSTLSALASDALDGFDPARPVAVICAGGDRSSAAASMLATRGFRKLLNVAGGTSAYVSAGYPVEKGSAQAG
jgi:rhodanese-related sulfurtransferase